MVAQCCACACVCRAAGARSQRCRWLAAPLCTHQQLVVVSPLRRTLETAAGVFGRRAAPAPTAAAAEGEAQWLLMMQQTAKPSEVTHQAALFLPPMSLSRRGVMAAAASSAAAVVGSGDGAGGGAGCGDEDAATAAADGSHHHSQQQQQPLKLLAHEGCRERIGEVSASMAVAVGVNVCARCVSLAQDCAALCCAASRWRRVPHCLMLRAGAVGARPTHRPQRV